MARGTALLVLLFTVALCLHTRHYWPFLTDDALISLRYLQRLLAGAGLTWNDGERVEGYSNLGWILLLVGPSALGLDPIVAARLAGVLCTLFAAACLAASYARREPGGLPAAAFGLAFLALSGPVAVWAIGGLEQPLVAALLALGVPLTWRVLEARVPSTRQVLAASLPFGVLCLVRPDAPLFAAAAGGVLLLARGGRSLSASLRVLALFALFPLLFLGGVLAFRLGYYGEFVPNTAHAKLAPSAAHLRSGLAYVGLGLAWALPLSALAGFALAGALRRPERRARALLLLGLGGVWSAYVIVIGGDYFAARRHLVPLFVLLCFALAEGIADTWPRLTARRARSGTCVFLALCAALFFGLQLCDPANREALRERWLWDGKHLALFLKRAFGAEEPLLAVTAAGCLPYWSELPALDMLGLNDRHIARTRPLDFGSGDVGHELGDGAYVLAREPDLIVYHVGLARPAYRSGFEMGRTVEYWTSYVAARFDTGPPDHRQPFVWVRKQSDKVGLRAVEGGRFAPGYLFSGVSAAALGADGRLRVRLGPSESAFLELFDLFETPRSVDAVPPSDVRASARSLGEGVLRIELENPSGAAVELEGVRLSGQS